AGRRKHDKLLMRRSTDMPKQCGFTRSGLAGQEEALVCAFDQAGLPNRIFRTSINVSIAITSRRRTNRSSHLPPNAGT
ncbi:hypothetical protein, partial [Porphyromonas gingivalis]|uniref:hypothetical protein n=1 Tax=Porphyromonas gingivalis TaxID=837 RepID=UPI001C54217A